MPEWRNRIVAEGEEPPDQLLAHPQNWRIHPHFQEEALNAVLEQVGWVQRVIVNRVTGHLVDGHLRVAAAISRGEPSVPVTYVELTPDEEAVVLATLDPLSALAATDEEKYMSVLEDIPDIAAISEGVREFIESITADFTPPSSPTEPREVNFEAGVGDDSVLFRFGDYAGRVSRPVFDSFAKRYELARKKDDAVLLDDVLKSWLKLGR